MGDVHGSEKPPPGSPHEVILPNITVCDSQRVQARSAGCKETAALTQLAVCLENGTPKVFLPHDKTPEVSVPQRARELHLSKARPGERGPILGQPASASAQSHSSPMRTGHSFSLLSLRAPMSTPQLQETRTLKQDTGE